MLHKHTLLNDFLGTKKIDNVVSSAQKYFKWIIIAAVTLFALAAIALVLLVIALLSFISNSFSNQMPTAQQGQAIFTEGQKWWEQRFGQEQQQLQDIQTQLNQLQQTLNEAENVLQPGAATDSPIGAEAEWLIQIVQNTEKGSP